MGIEFDKKGRRWVPRSVANIGIVAPRANTRASYKLGITIINQLEALSKLISNQQRALYRNYKKECQREGKKENKETWHEFQQREWETSNLKGFRFITTSDIARNVIKLGFDKLKELANEERKTEYELLCEIIAYEEPDREEEKLGLDYAHGKKYGAVGIRSE